MKKIFKIILLMIALKSTLYSNDYFVDMSIGYSYSPYSKSNLADNIPFSLDENGYLYDIALGYSFNKKIFSTINYQYSKFNEIDFDDYYTTLNYEFNHKLKPYIGGLIGISYLHWNKDPLSTSKSIDWTSGAFMYGIQTGLSYKITNKLSFISKIMYTKANHGTNLLSLPSKSHIENNSKTQALFGVRYLF